MNHSTEKLTAIETKTFQTIIDSAASNTQVVTPIVTERSWHLDEGITITASDTVGSNTPSITNIPTTELEELSLSSSQAWPKIAEITYPLSLSAKLTPSASYPTRRTITSNTWASKLAPTQTEASSILSQHQETPSTVYISTLMPTSLGLVIDISSSSAASSNATGLIPTPGPNTISSPRDGIEITDSPKSEVLSSPWPAGDKAVLIISMIIVPMVICWTWLKVWRILKNRRLKEKGRYDEEEETGGNKIIRRSKGVSDLYALSEGRNNRFGRSRKDQFAGECRKHSPISNTAIETVGAIDRATAIGSSPGLSPSITTSLSTDIGSSDESRYPYHASYVPEKVEEYYSSSSSDAGSSVEYIHTKENTGRCNPTGIQPPDTEVRDFFYSTSYKARSNSNKVLPMIPSLPSLKLDSFIQSFSSFESPKFPKIRGRASATVAEETRLGDSGFHVPASRVHFRDASTNCPRKFQSHGHGIPAKAMHRYTVYGRNVIDKSLLGRGEGEGEGAGESIQGIKASDEIVENRDISAGHMHGYGTLKGRLQGKSPARWG